MNKDQGRRRKGRAKKNKKRDEKPQDKREPTIVVRRGVCLRDVRSKSVIEFQDQPMFVRDLTTGDDGRVKLSLSPAFERPASDQDIECGRKAGERYYWEWSFTTRPLAPGLRVDRFISKSLTAVAA